MCIMSYELQSKKGGYDGYLFQRRGVNLDNHQNQPGISNSNNYMANNH